MVTVSIAIAVTIDTSCSCITGFKEMLEAPNLHRSGKKHSKQSTSSLTSSANQAGTLLSVPVIASAAPGGMMNHRDDMSSGLSGGHKAARIRRALAKLPWLPLNTSR